MIRRSLFWISKHFAVLVVAGMFAWSAIAIQARWTAETPPGAITLRISHWQLETSVREAFNELAADYRREVNPNVYIVQEAIPETSYGQWCSTQLMGGTAPDIVEIGKGLPNYVWVSYLNRYFIPLSRDVGKPNPYNRGTELEGVPFSRTFKDAMRKGYVDELQEYMTIPLSQFIVRVFYNKSLLRKLTGSDKGPADYRQFLDVCRRIAAQKDAKGRPYIPNAGSGYHMALWEWMMFDALTYSAVRKADFNRDGYLGSDELFVGVRTGMIGLDYPAYRAKFQMVREVTDFFPVGYTGLVRDDAVFLFAQQRSVFIATGTWDARSLQELAKDKFEVGVMDFPMPTRDDPEYGAYIEGPVYDKPDAGIPLAVNRKSKHPDVALDFLMYLTSRKGNEKFNRIAGWLPAIECTRKVDFLEGFEPHMEGVYAALNPAVGGDTWIKWSQLYALYKVRQIDFDQMMKQFGDFYKERGYRDFMEVQREWRRGMQANEQFLTDIRARALTAHGTKASELWTKYFVLTGTRQVWSEIEHARQMKMVECGPDEKMEPYEYGQRVIETVRRRLAIGDGMTGRSP